jgi:hypothetical protein
MHGEFSRVLKSGYKLQGLVLFNKSFNECVISNQNSEYLITFSYIINS